MRRLEITEAHGLYRVTTAYGEATSGDIRQAFAKAIRLTPEWDSKAIPIGPEWVAGMALLGDVLEILLGKMTESGIARTGTIHA